MRTDKQGCACDNASVGFQVVVGGVTCASLRSINEIDYVKEATVSYDTAKDDMEVVIDGMGKSRIVSGIRHVGRDDMNVVMDAVGGNSTHPLDVWIDDVVVQPVYRECVGWEVSV